MKNEVTLSRHTYISIAKGNQALISIESKVGTIEYAVAHLMNNRTLTHNVVIKWLLSNSEFRRLCNKTPCRVHIFIMLTYGVLNPAPSKLHSVELTRSGYIYPLMVKKGQ